MLKNKKFPVSFSVSIVFHIALAFLLSYYQFQKIEIKSEYTEITWGPSNLNLSNEMSIAELESGILNEGENSEKKTLSADLINLPASKSNSGDEKISSLSEKKKLKEDELINYNLKSTKKTTDESSKISDLSNIGAENNKIGRTKDLKVNEDKIVGKGGTGFGEGQNISYDIVWSNNLNRNLEKFQLPKYPAGVNVSTQIRIKLSVEPSGFISEAVVLQKGNTLLENAAISTVKKWKFESLQSGQKQQNQNCVVTFKFVLQ